MLKNILGIGSRLVACILFAPAILSSAEEGKYSYDQFEEPGTCGACHTAIYEEWQQSLMSQSFTHEWDEVEYFKLALPQALKLEKVSGVKSGCIGCHAPLAFLAGDIPPKPPAEGTRANEGVSCEICHNITGSTEKEPYNFSYTIEPGDIKRGPRKDGESGAHEIQYSEFTTSPELCATCHDEQSPYGAWVKSTYREWKEGPYGREGVRCQDCHMYHAPGKSSEDGIERKDIAHHTFHGSHVPGKLAGAIDIALYCEEDGIAPGKEARFRAELFNGKAGHSIPSGSAEERMLWLEVAITDSKGNTYYPQLMKKGFDGEEYTISDSKAVEYFAMGEIMGIDGFKGLKRDGDIPDGVRIFRKPFFDPEGRMTICQWYTAENSRIDYRIGPRETKIETYAWSVPANMAEGPVKLSAALYYSQVPSSVGKFLNLPPFEYEAIVVNRAEIEIE